MRNVHARFLDPHADCVRRTYGALDADKIEACQYISRTFVYRLPHNTLGALTAPP